MEKDLPPSVPADPFFRYMPQPACWLDGAARIVATTYAFDALFPATAVAQPAFVAVQGELRPGEGQTTWDDFWRRVQRSGEGTIRVERHRPGGPAAVLEVRGVVYHRDDAAYTGLLFTDVTGAVQLQQETERLVERFHSIVQEFPVMIYGLDAAYRVVVWNDQCERVTGYGRAEIGREPRALDRLYPVPDRVRAALDELSATGTFAGHEAAPVTHQFPNGRRIVSWLYRPNRTPLDEVSSWAIGIDLTQAYEAAHALAQNEERFRAISQATNDVLWDWDLHTDLVWWGSGMSRLFGHGMSQTTSHISWWVDHMHPDDRKPVFARLRDHIDRKEAFWLDEYRFRRSDNSYASVLDKGRIMFDAQGEPFRMVGGIRDVTDLKIALEKIQLRDRQLAEVSFYNSHKVRAPLARLMGLVQLLRMDPEASPNEQGELF